MPKISFWLALASAVMLVPYETSLAQSRRGGQDPRTLAELENAETFEDLKGDLERLKALADQIGREKRLHHADRDADDILAFKPTQTELLLYDACHEYRELTGEVVPLLSVYQSWFWLTTGADLVKNTERARIPEKLRQAFPEATRQSFFAEALPLASDLTLVGEGDA